MTCTLPPSGWSCTRHSGHLGRCDLVEKSSTEWPLSVPLDEERLERFLRIYEREYVNGMHSRFRPDLHIPRILDMMRERLPGDPDHWRGQFTNYKLHTLIKSCRTLDIRPGDLHFWLRGLYAGEMFKNRFDLIFEDW